MATAASVIASESSTRTTATTPSCLSGPPRTPRGCWAATSRSRWTTDPSRRTGGPVGTGTARDPATPGECARASPGELDLQLVLVVSELDLDLQVDLVGYPHCDPTTRARELDRVVPGKGVGQGVEPGRGLLATDVLGLIDLEQVHVVSS